MVYSQTVVIRADQALIEAATTMRFGTMAAAYRRMVVGPEGTRRLFKPLRNRCFSGFLMKVEQLCRKSTQLSMDRDGPFLTPL